MADIALTNIIHGNDDGSVTRYEYGASVSDLPADVRKQLKEEGVIGPEPMANSEAQNEIEILKAQLLEAEARLEAFKEAQDDSKPETPLDVKLVDDKGNTKK